MFFIDHSVSTLLSAFACKEDSFAAPALEGFVQLEETHVNNDCETRSLLPPYNMRWENRIRLPRASQERWKFAWDSQGNWDPPLPTLLLCVAEGPGTSPISLVVCVCNDCWGEICEKGSGASGHLTQLGLCSLLQQKVSCPVLQDPMALERGLQGPRTLQNVLTWSQVSPAVCSDFSVSSAVNLWS